MKKFIKVLLVVCMLLGVFTCTACTGDEGEVTLIVVDGANVTYTVDTTGSEMTTLQDLLDYLEKSEEYEFSYSESAGMLEEVNGATYKWNEEPYKWWAIYTDAKVGDIPYYDNSWGTVTVLEKEYGSASQGISDLPLTSGATYILAVQG